MPDFDDVSQPPHLRPQIDYSISIIERYTILLRDGETTATIYPIHSAEELPPGLLAFLCDEFNMEIDRGDTFPFFDTLHIETFQNYWFGSFAAVMVLGDVPTLDRSKQWEKECLGTFYIKPNYPGRCSHICTAGFLVNAGIRGKGIGRTLAECYLEWAPRLGYTYSIFNLVFETNDLARKIWDSLGFKVIGKIKSAGILKGYDLAIDAFIYGRELMLNHDSNGGSFRFDRIRYYLETGKYPKNLDRQEKSRLRSSASHYRLLGGKLMLKGREVISDPTTQLDIATSYHRRGHPGINKSTAAILERYHWSRIKDTVAIVIRDCDECRLLRGQPSKRPTPLTLQLKAPRLNLIAKYQQGDKLSKQQLKTPSLPSSINKNSAIHLPNFNHLNPQVNLGTNNNGNNHGNQHLLGTEFDSDDPSGILAAVEAAQRSHTEQQQQQQQPASSKADGKTLDESENQLPKQLNSYEGRHESQPPSQQQQLLLLLKHSQEQQPQQQPQQHHVQVVSHHHDHGRDENEHFNYNHGDEIDPDVISRALIQGSEDESVDNDTSI